MSQRRCHVGIIASLAPATGNHAMALRLERAFSKLGYRYDKFGMTYSFVRCTMFDVHNQHLASELVQRAEHDQIVAFLGIHLLRAGWPLVQQRLPYALVIGGTDINEHALRPELHSRMSRAISTADTVVAMHPDLSARFAQLWPEHAAKLTVIPAALSLCVPRTPSHKPSFRLHSALGLAHESHIFLLPTNLRPVKDPLFLVDAFEKWHSIEPTVHMALVGPVLDAAFSASVKAQIATCKGVHYHEPVSAVAMQEAMQQCFAVLNSSRSEGLCTSILEAMAVGTPVLARRNAGNMSLLKHDDTGLLFNTPDELVMLAKRLLSNPEMGKRLATQARKYVRAYYAPASERRAYEVLLRNLMRQAKL